MRDLKVPRYLLVVLLALLLVVAVLAIWGAAPSAPEPFRWKDPASYSKECLSPEGWHCYFRSGGER